MGNMTRRTFIQSAGALAARAAAGGTVLPEHEIKEHGLVEIRAWFFAKDPIIIKSTIFSDERRGVFGVRLLGRRGPCDARLAEMRLSAVKAAVAVPGRVQKCAITTWNGEGRKEEGFLDLVARDGNLVVAGTGQIEKAPVWMSLADVRQVL
jgi:hypothetical protein